MTGNASLIEKIAEKARPKLRDPRSPLRCWLIAPPEADAEPFLEQAARMLRSKGRAVIHLHLPSSGVLDAGEHLLGQLCEGFEPSRLPRASFQASHPIHKRVAWISRGFGIEKSAPVVLMCIPDGWFLRRWDERHTLPDKPLELIKALLESSGLDAVVVSRKSREWLKRLLGQPWGELSEPGAKTDSLLDIGRWRSAADEARRLAAVLGTKTMKRPLFHLELAVACKAIGLADDEVCRAIAAESPQHALIKLLQSKLQVEDAWHEPLRRLSLPRFPVPRGLLEEIIGPMTDGPRGLMDALVEEDENGNAMVPDVLHSLVDQRIGQPMANERLAQYYQSLDGVSTVEHALQRKCVIPWLERSHHLGHAGPRGREALRDIVPLSRMSRYELAWSLSYEYREYELAAEVYQQLWEEQPSDAYSHHYHGWNLDRAGKTLEIVLREYKKALQLEPENPWYNSRYITCLRDNGFQREAREAFREARRIVSAGRWARMKDLPEHFHRWVARSALDAGDLVLAREVLDSLSREECHQRPKLRPLLQELEHFEDVERVGEPMYPFEVPVEKRWRDRYLLPANISDERLPPGRQKAKVSAFYPGRVLAIEEGVVSLLLANPAEDPPALFTVEMSDDELSEVAEGDVPRVGQFLELGHYEGDIVRVRYHKGRGTSPDRSSFTDSLRHIRDESKTVEDD